MFIPSKVTEKTSVLIFLIALTLCGCFTDDMDEMKASTSRLAQTTDKMAEKTESLDRKTGQMSQYTGSLYSLGKAPAAWETRDKAFANLLSHSDVDEKALYAAAYLTAFDFELMQTFEEQADCELRTKKTNQAMKEFFYRLAGLIKEGRPISLSFFAKLTWMNRFYSLEAIAGASHLSNEDTDQVKKQSIFQLISKTLKKDFDSQSKPTSFEPYEDTVLRHKEDAIYLLELRAGYLAKVTLKGLASIPNFRFFPNLRGELFISQFLHLKDWKPSHPGELANPHKLKYWASALDLSIKTLQLLKEVGYSPRIDRNIQKLYQNLDLSEVRRALASSTDQVNTDPLSSLETKIQDFIKEMQ